VATKNAVKKAIKRNALRINGQFADTGIWVKDGDLIELVDPQIKPPKEFDLEIPIVYDDEFLAAVYKPSGLVVSGNQHRTLTNALVGKLKESNEPDAYQWGHPVHRLDAATSGLVLVAKTAKAQRGLGKLFENRSINKTYHAVVQGVPESQQIKLPVKDQTASSQLNFIESVDSLRNGKLSLIQLQPKTGRTHQLRIHCAEIGCPIVGDKLYGKAGEIMNHKGLFLAATRLEFGHPITDVAMDISIPIPHKFEALLRREQRRWDGKNV